MLMTRPFHHIHSLDDRLCSHTTGPGSYQPWVLGRFAIVVVDALRVRVFVSFQPRQCYYCLTHHLPFLCLFFADHLKMAGTISYVVALHQLAGN
ncbi:hypothetical protein Pelo_6861 [Pelomyxa schiedti]|nr:hypothetical protein Pelo_6861 [Pelomyxa schiedti]